MRYSVVRWLPSTAENASGPHISDPRTGEILNADIQFYHNVMNLARDWYFVQVGPLDPRAQKLPLPDDLMGRLLEYVVCHEVGHTLGFQHNMKASAMYPPDKIRDKDWVHKMGHTPSIMDYSRFNYVAQPEDGIEVEDLVPRIGPYDIWATHWGYAPIAGAKTPEEEKPTLDKWAREQDNTPWFRFSTANSAGSDPGDETEAVGDADAVKSTRSGMKNLQRVAKMLMSATAWQEGETYEDLSEVYGRMLSQWQTEMNHVAQMVGRLDSQEKVVGQEGRVFTLVPKARQEEAAKFLVDNAIRYAGLDDGSRDSAPHRGEWRADAHPQRADQRAEPVAERSALRALDRAADDRWQCGVYGRGVALDRPQGRVEGTGCAHGEDRCLPAQPAERLSRHRQHQTESGVTAAPAAAAAAGGGRGGRGGAP